MNMNMDTKMFGSAFMNRMFRQVDGVVWDLMSGNIGVQTDEGIVTFGKDADGNAEINLNLFDQFGMAVPAFAQNTPKVNVVEGDLLVGAKDILGWVVEKKDNSFVLLKPNGNRGTWSPPKVNLMGAVDGGVMVLRSLMSMLPGGAGGLGQMQNMLLPMLMMGGDDMDMSKIMPLMLFSQLGNPAVTGGDPAAAPAGGANGMGQMMQTMMMMQMMGGKGGANPVANFFDRKAR